MEIAVVLYTDDGNKYGVTVSNTPGCFSYDESIKEALDSVVEAIERHLALVAESGESLPSQRPIKILQEIEEYSGGTWAIVDIDIAPYLDKPKRINANRRALCGWFESECGSSDFMMEREQPEEQERDSF